uniref:Uncharacterized protein n=1 Tax=Anguilla anguilla TaxID=7936 RepID=A0A0E9W8Q6_ANGAN
MSEQYCINVRIVDWFFNIKVHFTKWQHELLSFTQIHAHMYMHVCIPT